MKKDLRKKQCKKESHVVIPTRRTSNKTAFTLAEVLITLGIIGVVAALTMPGLIQNYKERATIAKVKKAYTTLSQVYRQVFNEYGYAREWEDSESGINRTVELFQPYFNSIKTCKKNSDKTVCSKIQNIYALNGEHITESGIQSSALSAFTVLNDGTTILFGGGENAYILLENKENLIANKNIFHVSFRNNGTVAPMSCARSHDPLNLYNGTVGNGCPPSAINWIMLYDNMDYMHCAQELHDSGKHACKDL